MRFLVYDELEFVIVEGSCLEDVVNMVTWDVDEDGYFLDGRYYDWAGKVYVEEIPTDLLQRYVLGPAIAPTLPGLE